MQLCGSSKPSSLWREVSRRWKRTVNRDEYYLPEVRHSSRKWALWGDVSRVARVMVHLGEKEQSATQCSGADWRMRKPRLCKKASIENLYLDAGMKHLPLLHVFFLFHSSTRLCHWEKVRSNRKPAYPEHPDRFEGHDLYVCLMNCDETLDITFAAKDQRQPFTVWSIK